MSFSYRFKISLLGCALGAALPVSSCAQSSPELDAKSAIEQLDFLVGHWAGDGVSYDKDGVKTQYYDTEHVRFDLDRNLLLINAQGQRYGDTTYQLHTVIYYDEAAGNYVYTPYSGMRTPRPFRCDLVAEQFICLTEAKTFRLIFQRLPDGHWNEFGERLEDGVWRKTFETKLRPLAAD